MLNVECQTTDQFASVPKASEVSLPRLVDRSSVQEMKTVKLNKVVAMMAFVATHVYKRSHVEQMLNVRLLIEKPNVHALPVSMATHLLPVSKVSNFFKYYLFLGILVYTIVFLNLI
jgi:hypothetical protein